MAGQKDERLGSLIQRLAQLAEVRIEGNKASQSLKESLASGFVRNTIQRALTIAGSQMTVTGQSHRRSIECVDGNVACIGLTGRACEIDGITRAGCIEAVRNIKTIGHEQHGVAAFPTRIELTKRFNDLDVRIVGRPCGAGGWNT